MTKATRVGARFRRRYYLLLARALICLAASSAIARADDNAASTLIFGSLEAAPSAFVTGGAKLAFDRIDREGFVALASVGGGSRPERGPSAVGAVPTQAMRHTGIGAAVFGYQWFRDWGVVAAYAGPEASIEALSGNGGIAVLPARVGLRLHGEVWARPTEETLLTTSLVLGSTRGSAWGRVSGGYRLWGAYLGPEASLYMDSTGYRKWGIGVHATDVRFGDVGLRVSAGYQVETGSGGAPYVTLTLWTPL